MILGSGTFESMGPAMYDEMLELERENHKRQVEAARDGVEWASTEAARIWAEEDRAMSDCDNWKHRSQGMRCATCISFVPKTVEHQDGSTPRPVIGRCRKHAPTLQGWPVVFESDWCGDHKIDEEKLR